MHFFGNTMNILATGRLKLHFTNRNTPVRTYQPVNINQNRIGMDRIGINRTQEDSRGKLEESWKTILKDPQRCSSNFPSCTSVTK